ncbi:Ran GAP Rna1 [Binucleata daphniae]
MIFSIAGQKKRYETEESVSDLIIILENNKDKITEINFRDNVFLQPALLPLFKAIKQIQNLKKITLSRIFSALPKETMMECFKIILENLNPENLHFLDLSQNAISCNFPEFFTNFLQKLDKLKTLKIDNCGLGTTGGVNLAKALKNIKNKSDLHSIDISTNKLVSSAKELGEALNEFTNLEEVYIQYNNVDRESMLAFLRSFENHSLSKLDLRDNFINVCGCELLGEYFVTWDLEELRMGDCLIKDEGLKAFVNNAKEKIKYTMYQGGYTGNEGIELDLSFNGITNEGIKELEEFLCDVNVKLLRIEGNYFFECDDLTFLVQNNGGEIIYEEEDSMEENLIEEVHEKLKNL